MCERAQSVVPLIICTESTNANTMATPTRQRAYYAFLYYQFIIYLIEAVMSFYYPLFWWIDTYMTKRLTF